MPHKDPVKIAVIGATGFIGKNLVTELNTRKTPFVCIVRKESNTVFLKQMAYASHIVSTFSIEDLTKALQGIDIVIDLAGQVGGDGITKVDFERGNNELTKSIVNACIKAGVSQLIYISTPGVQGLGHRLCEETQPYAPRGDYEKTKVRAEILIRKMSKNTGTHHTIIRPDFVYGPGDFRRIPLYKSIRDKRFILTVSGKAHVHPTYVMDVVQGILLAAGNEKAYDETFNISAETDISVQRYLKTIANSLDSRLIHVNIGYPASIMLAGMVECICKILKKNAIVSKSKIQFLGLDHSTSIKKAREVLGYAPKYDFVDGFEFTLGWCKDEGVL